MRQLIIYEDYSREEVHDIFAPNDSFIPQRGDWGLRGIVQVKGRLGDFVFFVTFGQEQSGHVFDEGVTRDGVLTWQSEPNQALDNPRIRRLIQHDELRNTIYLFLRTRAGIKYTYLGRLKYLSHEPERERPVYFQWQILDWEISEDRLGQIGLILQVSFPITSPPRQDIRNQLVETPPPSPAEVGRARRAAFRGRRVADYSARDARNRELGRAGQRLVLAHEQNSLREPGLNELADSVLDISELEGDGAGYDIKSWMPNGNVKYIEVKTTKGPKETSFFMSSNEVEFARQHIGSYFLYRVYEYDETTNTGNFYVVNGDIEHFFVLTPTQHRVSIRARDEDAGRIT